MTDFYKEALDKIREQQNRVSSIQARTIENAVAAFVGTVTRTKHISTSTALQSFWSSLQHAASTVASQIDGAIVAGVERMIEKTIQIWHEAGADEAGDKKDEYLKLVAPVSAVVLASLLAPRAWKTVLSQYSRQAAEEVGTTYADLLRRGMDPEELARRLRKYVLGSERFDQAFPEMDLRTIPHHLRNTAGQMVFNATRIAFTEFHNARALAETKLFISDPLVEAVQWTLSPNRGTLKSPDVCDLLAGTDFYGLGRGIYPVRKVPATPHPFDRCERMPVKRDWLRRNDPKPNPELVVTPHDQSVVFPRGGRITANAAARARETAMQAIMDPMG